MLLRTVLATIESIFSSRGWVRPTMMREWRGVPIEQLAMLEREAVVMAWVGLPTLATPTHCDAPERSVVLKGLGI